MQEEVENRTLTLVVSGTKFTGRLMKAAITKYLAHRKEAVWEGCSAESLFFDKAMRFNRKPFS